MNATRIFVTVLLAIAHGAFSQTTATLSVGGTSNLHDWESRVTKAVVKLDVPSGNASSPTIRAVSVVVPVKSIVSEHDLMNKKTYEAFNEPKNPNISFEAKDVRFVADAVVMTGMLTMNGTTKPATIKGSAKVAKGELTISGVHAIDMTQFGMVPPTAVMGTIKVGRIVNVKFEVTYRL